MTVDYTNKHEWVDRSPEEIAACMAADNALGTVENPPEVAHLGYIKFNAASAAGVPNGALHGAIYALCKPYKVK